MRLATLAIAIFSLGAGDHTTQPHSALVKVVDYRPHLESLPLPAA